MDETWIHQYTLESRGGLKQWVKPDGSASKRPKMQQSADKVMNSVFWDAHGVLLEHIILNYWIDWLTKSVKNGHI